MPFLSEYDHHAVVPNLLCNFHLTMNRTSKRSAIVAASIGVTHIDRNIIKCKSHIRAHYYMKSKLICFSIWLNKVVEWSTGVLQSIVEGILDDEPELTLQSLTRMNSKLCKILGLGSLTCYLTLPTACQYCGIVSINECTYSTG